MSSGSTIVASFELIGSYATPNFVLGAATDNSVLITDPSVVTGGGHSANVALFGNYLAASFVAAGGAVFAEHAAADQVSPVSLLAKPHG